MITHRSTLAVKILSTLAYNNTQDNHLDNISGIRTRAIEIVSIFKMDLGWEKDMIQIFGYGKNCKRYCFILKKGGKIKRHVTISKKELG